MPTRLRHGCCHAVSRPGQRGYAGLRPTHGKRVWLRMRGALDMDTLLYDNPACLYYAFGSCGFDEDMSDHCNAQQQQIGARP